MTENNKCEHGFANGVTYLLIGGTIGAVLGLLFAPKSGLKLRGDIADVSRKGYDATLEKADELKRRSTDAVQTVKDKAEAVYDFASGKLASGKDVVTDAISEAAGSVMDGLEGLQSESNSHSKQAKNGQKASNIV
ncbi:MAG: YtxH domain-containing protein [Chloracidobacterium sp.]|nr:YtxH domain-containing protein [Chloracidobacterium sp.]